MQFLICFSTSVMLALVPRFYSEGHKHLLKFDLTWFFPLVHHSGSSDHAVGLPGLVISAIWSWFSLITSQDVECTCCFFFWIGAKYGGTRFSVFCWILSCCGFANWNKTLQWTKLCCPSWQCNCIFLKNNNDCSRQFSALPERRLLNPMTWGCPCATVKKNKKKL